MKHRRSSLAASVFMLAGMVTPVAAQSASEITMEDLAQNPDMFVAVATKAAKWEEPAEPFHIGGPLYSVSTVGLGIFLFKTSEGLILVNTGMPSSGPMIEESIRKLDMDPKDIRLIVTSHAHIDHAGGHAYLQRLSGAKIVTSVGEASRMETGGQDDVFYGPYKGFWYEATKPDIILNDGQSVSLGEITLTGYVTAGHATGSMTWVTKISDQGKEYLVVFPDGTGVNPGYRVAVDPMYPGIEDDYTHTFEVLESLKPDIWLALHNDTDGFVDKSARTASEGIAAWVDPEGYKQFVAIQREKFDDALAAERATVP
jgi:metallo-beta-lactamase class B